MKPAARYSLEGLDAQRPITEALSAPFAKPRNAAEPATLVPRLQPIAIVGWAEPGEAGGSPCRSAPPHDNMGVAPLSPSHGLSPPFAKPQTSGHPVCVGRMSKA